MDEEHDRTGRRVAQRWVPSALVVVVAVVTIALGRLNAAALAVAGVLMALAWALSPWFFPRSRTDASARELASTHNVQSIYWRPGCS